MATRPDYVKIGLFVLLCLGAGLTAAIGLGVTSLHRKTISYVTYFDEDVVGLDVGSSVKVRGVTAGRVGAITIAPDHRMVEVRSDLDVDVLERLGLRPRGLPGSVSTIPPDVRAQLMSQGLTGNRFVGLDIFDPAKNPPPQLAFATPAHYIPAARSVQRSLEESATKAMEGLADIVTLLVQEHVDERLVHTIAEADAALTALNRTAESADEERISARAAAAIDEVRQAASSINSVLDHLDGRTGLVASAQRSFDSLGDVGRNATDASHNLGSTLVEIREAAGAIRLLAEQIERDPDMLIKGRAKGSSP